MSWSLFLSEYPDSLFQDSLAMLALALLERSGLQTEDDLAAQAKTETRKIAKTLLALHRDRCIEYTRDYVRITERGRDFIDRLVLQKDIIDDLLISLEIPESEKPMIRRIILDYRAQSFSRYVDSITSIRAWNKTCQSPFLSRSKEPSGMQSGALAIVLRDLQMWMLASGKTVNRSESQKGLKSGTRKVDVAHIVLGVKRPMSKTLIKASEWLNTCEEIIHSHQPLVAFHAIDSQYLKVFVTQNFSREQEDFLIWLHDWTNKSGKWVKNLSVYKHVDIIELSKPVLEEKNIMRYSSYLKQPQGRHDSPPIMRKSLGELLAIMLHSESISEMAVKTNSNEEDVVKIMRRLSALCNDILYGRSAHDAIRLRPGVSSLDDLSNRVLDSIKSVPPMSHATGKPGLQELLFQLKDSIEADGSISQTSKVDALTEVIELARAAEDPHKNASLARRSIYTLKGLNESFKDSVELETTVKSLISLISPFFLQHTQ